MDKKYTLTFCLWLVIRALIIWTIQLHMQNVVAFLRHHHPTRAVTLGKQSKRALQERSFLALSSDSEYGVHKEESAPPPATTFETERMFHYQRLMQSSKLSLAPMMEYTDRHFRHLMRILSRNTLVYTEMVGANALSRERWDRMQEYLQQPNKENNNNNNNNGVTKEDSGLSYFDRATFTPEMKHQYRLDDARHRYDPNYIVHRYIGQSTLPPAAGPSVLQLGGSDPNQLYEATQIVMDLVDRGYPSCDYTALNLNCGCPSPKVAGKGCFGAALMEQPDLVADLVHAMHDGCQGRRPITVKCRIGTDQGRESWRDANSKKEEEAEYRTLCHFIERVASSGIVTDFSIHARIAVLSKSWSPSDNRKIPPLKYDVVHRLTRDYPELTFTLNGGVNTLPQVQQELEREPKLIGVMVGRGMVADPWGFALADSLLYGNDVPLSSLSSGNDMERCRNRLEVLQQYGQHADAEEAIYGPAHVRRYLLKAITPLFNGEPNSKRFRVALDRIMHEIKKQPQGRGVVSSHTATSTVQPPLSELILNAALETLSDETLMRSPEESYERVLVEQKKIWDNNQGGSSKDVFSSVAEWQAERNQERLNV
jgi:tRNA-dihydrouridine synthase A